MPEVPSTPTPLDDQAMASILRTEFRDEFGRLPTRPEAAYLLAHVWLETRRGAAIIQNNWGNISARPGSGVAYWRPPWFEVTEASTPRYVFLHQQMLAGKAPEAFRAYEHHGQGARAYLSLLRSRYPRIVRAAGAGNALAMAEAIQKDGYCPDCEVVPTSRTLARLALDAAALPEFADLPAGRAVARSSSSSSVGAVAFGIVLGVGGVAIALHVQKRRRAAGA
jgi:hypothetical protein